MPKRESPILGKAAIGERAPGERQSDFTGREWRFIRKEFMLTPRELDVVWELFATRHRPEIAQVLGLSLHTVDFHIQNAFAKIGVHDRGDMIVAVMRRVLRLRQESA